MFSTPHFESLFSPPNLHIMYRFLAGITRHKVAAARAARVKPGYEFKSADQQSEQKLSLAGFVTQIKDCLNTGKDTNSLVEESNTNLSHGWNAK